MKIPLGILALVALLLLAFSLLTPEPGPDVREPRTDLPWQVKVNADGGSRVFDIELGSATLAEAMAKFGGIEGLALFRRSSGRVMTTPREPPDSTQLDSASSSGPFKRAICSLLASTTVAAA